jgi:hypothetical protein
MLGYQFKSVQKDVSLGKALDNKEEGEKLS